jgi:hypothetical protein
LRGIEWSKLETRIACGRFSPPTPGTRDETKKEQYERTIALGRRMWLGEKEAAVRFYERLGKEFPEDMNILMETGKM